MKQRTLTSIFILIPVLLAMASKFLPLNIGTYVFDVFVLVIAIVSALELCNMMERGNKTVNKYLTVAYPILNYIMLICIKPFVSYKYWVLLELALLLVYFIVILIVANNRYKESQEKQTFKIALNTLSVCVYPSFLLGLFININHIDYYANATNLSIILILAIFTITMLTDTFAYLVGSAVRGPKLAPKISPNKTISGAIGGLFGGVAGAILVFVITSNIPGFKAVYETVNLSWVHFTLMGLFGSVLGQCGDLLESKIKRWSNVKDSGKLFPGHGGMLDRIDAMVFVILYVFIATLIIL